MKKTLIITFCILSVAGGFVYAQRQKPAEQKTFRERIESLEEQIESLSKRVDILEQEIRILKQVTTASPSSKENSKNVISDKKNNSNTPDVGEQGFLEGRFIFGPENPKCVALAVSKETLNDWTEANIAHDAIGASNLLLSGKMFIVADGTKILRLSQTGLFIRKVRILEGEHSGRIGWIESDWAKK